MTNVVKRFRTSSGLAPFVAYVVVFHGVWILWPFVVYPRLQEVGDRTLIYAVINLAIRLAVWVAPVLLYLRWIDGVNPIEYLKLRPKIRRGIAIGLVLTALNLLGMCLRFGLPYPTLERVSWNSVLGTSLMVGVIEEIPYLLHTLRGRKARWYEPAVSVRSARRGAVAFRLQRARVPVRVLRHRGVAVLKPVLAVLLSRMPASRGGRVALGAASGDSHWTPLADARLRA